MGSKKLKNIDNILYIILIIVLVLIFVSLVYTSRSNIIEKLSNFHLNNKPLNNKSKLLEDKINEHINYELYASYVYLGMSAHFNKKDVALPGFAKYFADESEEEKGHALGFIEYLNKRGGNLKLFDIKAPKVTWNTTIEIMEEALKLEKKMNQQLMDLSNLAEEADDHWWADFIDNYLAHQVEHIKELSDYISNLKRVGPGLGEFHFDQITLGGSNLKKENKNSKKE
jgi:ferritin heavy chain